MRSLTIVVIFVALAGFNIQAQSIYITGGISGYENSVSSQGWGVGISQTVEGLKLAIGYNKKQSFLSPDKKVKQTDSGIHMEAMKSWQTEDTSSEGFLVFNLGGYMDIAVDYKGDEVGRSSGTGVVIETGLKQSKFQALVHIERGLSNNQYFAGVLFACNLIE